MKTQKENKDTETTAGHTPASLFERIKAAGVLYDNHESDLYFESTEISRAILNQFPDKKAIATSFLSNTDHGKRWIDVPFAFLPWWELRAAIARATNP